MVSVNQLEKPRQNEKRIGEKALKKIIESEDFYTKEKTLITQRGAVDFFYFHEYGDYLKGQLLSKQKNDDIKRQASYRIRVEAMRHDGVDVPLTKQEIREFPANKHLQHTIDKNELLGSTIRIVYIGRQKTRFGHSAKIFDVFKVTGVFSEKESYQDGTKRPYKRRSGTKPKSGAAKLRIASGRTR